MERYDVVVVGVGGMGSAALYHLARRGKRVLGLERFDLLHEHGSSHGLTRIIRLAYFEHPDYVPLLRRAYELWRELESEAGEQLLHVTGIVEGGERILDGVLRSCAEHDLEHEVLDGARSRAVSRLTGFRRTWRSCTSPTAASSSPSAASSRTSRARSREEPCCERVNGCSSGRRREAASAFAPTVAASRPSASCSPLARGPRTSRGSRPARFAAVRQALAWFQPTRPELFTPERMPVFNLVLDGEHFYGFPAYGIPGFKLGRYDHFRARRRPRRDLARADARRRGAAARVRASATSPTEPARPLRSRPASSSPHPTSTS